MSVLSHLAFAQDAQAWQAALGLRAWGLRFAPGGSPQSRCALGWSHAPARWGPTTEPLLSPAGTPGWRATGAPRQVFLRPGADRPAAPRKLRTHARARPRLPPDCLQSSSAGCLGRCRGEVVAGRVTRAAYCNSESFRKESRGVRGSQTAPRGHEGREGECSRKASMERCSSRPPSDLSDKTGNGGRG